MGDHAPLKSMGRTQPTVFGLAAGRESPSAFIVEQPKRQLVTAYWSIFAVKFQPHPSKRAWTTVSAVALLGSVYAIPLY